MNNFLDPNQQSRLSLDKGFKEANRYANGGIEIMKRKIPEPQLLGEFLIKYQEVLKDYEDEASSYKKFLKVKNNKFLNALQVKFSYAITCHKSQGGQWHTVFVEQPYLPEGINKDYLRWLYTAVTRAKEKLYLIGFKDDFFEA